MTVQTPTDLTDVALGGDVLQWPPPPQRPFRVMSR